MGAASPRAKALGFPEIYYRLIGYGAGQPWLGPHQGCETFGWSVRALEGLIDYRGSLVLGTSSALPTNRLRRLRFLSCYRLIDYGASESQHAKEARWRGGRSRCRTLNGHEGSGRVPGLRAGRLAKFTRSNHHTTPPVDPANSSTLTPGQCFPVRTCAWLTGGGGRCGGGGVKRGGPVRWFLS